MPKSYAQERTKKIMNQPVSLLSCAPKAITGSAEAKKIYIVGANIMSLH